MMPSAPRTDWVAYVLGGLPGVLLACAAGTGLISERVALLLFAPSFLILNLAHMAGTWTHAWLDPEQLRAARIERVWIPALIVLACLAIDAAGGIVLLLTIQCWVSLHHATMQNYGLLRASQRSSGRHFTDRSLRLDQAACVLLPLGALTQRFRVTAREYDGATMPVPPLWLAALLLAGGTVALLSFIAREVAAARRGEGVEPLGVALVVSTNVVWAGLLLGLSHAALPLYAIASGHYLQQLYFIWRAPGTPSRVANLRGPVRLFLATRIGFVLGLAGAAGVVVFALTAVTVALRSVSASNTAIPPWVAAMVGVNFSHYWLEHRIWRRTPRSTSHGLQTQLAANGVTRR
ncbi:MAG: hypothetical protein QM817_40630 [Archangium sp.]